MISYHLNNFEVVINMSQVPIELSPPHARIWGGGGGRGREIAQLIKKTHQTILFKLWEFLVSRQVGTTLVEKFTEF